MEVVTTEKHVSEYPDPFYLKQGDKVALGAIDDEFPNWIFITSSEGGKVGLQFNISKRLKASLKVFYFKTMTMLSSIQSLVKSCQCYLNSMSGIEFRGQRGKLVGYQCARHNVHNRLFKRGRNAWYFRYALV